MEEVQYISYEGYDLGDVQLLNDLATPEELRIKNDFYIEKEYETINELKEILPEYDIIWEGNL